MANCEITDKYGYWSATGTLVGVDSALIYAVPDLNSRRYLDGGGTFRPLAVNPLITTNAAYRLGRVATTAGGGSYTFNLPYGSAATHPTTPTPYWTIVLPDGKKLTGIVPDAAGPFTLDDLATATGTGVAAWTWINEVYVAPVTAGVLAEGKVTITADSTSTIVFATAFASTPRITLTASLDSVTGGVVEANYTADSASGFTIALSAVATCTVCWSAKL